MTRRHFTAAALLLASGAAGLAHQILWMRVMVDALGADAGTFAVVAGAFFLGLSLGAWAADRWTPRHPALGVALAEIAVAILSIGALFVARSDWLTALPPTSAEIAKSFLPLLLVGLPASSMGLVFPWLIRVIGASPRATVALYGVNTLGGIVGILATTILFLPTLGLTNAVLCAAAANGLAAALALTLPSSTTNEPIVPKGEKSRHTPALVAFASGFLILAQETIAQHQVAQVTVNSLFSSAAVLTAVLAALALATLIHTLVPRLSRLAPALFLAALACVAQPFIFVAWTDGLTPFSWQLSTAAYYARSAALLLVGVAPVFLCVGLVFPATLRLVPPARVGTLLAWNGLGGWLGAELTNRFLAPAFGLWQTMALLACAYVGLLARLHPRTALALVPLIVLALLFEANLPVVARAPGEAVQSAILAREGLVASVRRSSEDHRILFNNSYSLGGSLARQNQERQAHLPILLHGSARSVATLGVATGSTLAGAAQHPSVEHLKAIELSPAAAHIARTQFAPFNDDVFADPRVDLTLGDARWVIARHPAEYDVIIGDLFLPWRTGEGRLFTEEHFENVRTALRPDGLYCQWLPLFQLTRPQFEVILRTFRAAFPKAFLIRGDFYGNQPIVGLVGGRGWDDLDWPQIETATRALAQNTNDPLATHAEGVAMLLLGPAPAQPGGPVNTLANAWLEWNAGRNVIGLAEPWFTGDSFTDYAAALSRSSRTVLPTQLQPAHAAGETLAVDPPVRIEELLPNSLRNDLRADWTAWPGQRKPYSR